MKQTAKWIFKSARAVVVTLLVLAVVLPALLYAALQLPAVQLRLKSEGEKALSDLLHTRATIGSVSIAPFNQLVLHDVIVPDQQGDSLLIVETLGAAIDLAVLAKERRLLYTYGEINGLKGRITRPDANSPTNAQFLVDAFKPKPNQPPKPFDVEVRGVVIRNSELAYDVLDQPRRQAGRFDPNHIRLDNIKADVALPRLRNNEFDIHVKRLAFDEQSGFVLKNLAVRALVTDTLMEVQGLRVELPHSLVQPADVALSYSSLKSLGGEIRTIPLTLQVHEATLTPADLSAFVPALSAWNEALTVTATVHGSAALDEVRVPVLRVSDTSQQLSVDLNGSVAGLSAPQQLRYAFPHLRASLSASMLARVCNLLPALSPQARQVVERCGNVEVDASVQGDRSAVGLNGKLSTSCGSLQVNGLFADNGNKSFKGHLSTPGLRVGDLIGKRDLIGEVAVDADLDAMLRGREPSGSINGRVHHIDLKGRRLHNIVADVKADGGDYEGSISIDDPMGAVQAAGKLRLAGADTRINATADVRHLTPAVWGVKGKWAGAALDFRAQASFVGNQIDNATGTVDVTDIAITQAEGKLITLDHLAVTADNASAPQRVVVDCDLLNGYITGRYDFETLVPTVKSMLSVPFPQYFSAYTSRRGIPNDLSFHFAVEPSEKLQQLVGLPVTLLDKVTLDGAVEETTGDINLNIAAPYLLQGNKLIEGTALTARLDSTTRDVIVQATTLVPSKNGKIAVALDAAGVNDRIDVNLGWQVVRRPGFHGDLNLSALVQRTPEHRLDAVIDINPTSLVFNDTVWRVEPGQVRICNGVIDVDHIEGHNDQQWVRIGGKVSKDPEDQLCLELNDISLDYVFETLNIPNVDFGGRATGKFFASDLLSGQPRLSTPLLRVDDLSYNDAVMGDADIQSHWDSDTKSVALRANVAQRNGRNTLIDGAIFVANDSLYLTFDADHVNIAFMRPFMAAFTSDVLGEVSGHAVLAGNFSTIDLEGDVRADSLRFKLAYTGVTYTCAGDSVHIVPNFIQFDNVRIHDRDGHEARFDGWLRHDAFHNPRFEFAVTQANDLLCFDTHETDNPVWYGTIYGDGAAFVKGEPGQVDIKVNMVSSPHSTFTFVLSDAVEAGDYNFITYRDRRDAPVASQPTDTLPETVRQHLARAKEQEQSQPTHYTIDLQGDITPDAQLILVMDPVGGDRVRATGRGSMRMTYNDADEMAIYGTYTIERGNYNFTLQDIIIKDFTIRDGSSITFQGDPYAATLDLVAAYALNANLRDLDESLAQDKEITRTNVPVHALLHAKGPISEPDISFDLEFPTLPSDTYRKVKSIVNTDEMMNQQIIYLLALNRFYTPDYLRGGNELSSVASSTISSQLGNMLGKMSDKWSISPNFRSDKGDFTDMEVDVALSSRLLNNRLLINGNLGYRDQTYTNQGSNFIGDFDIEYLLNPRGTMRLKAYNHFNDQNYYLRNALTTQGVGVMWKHDFDGAFDFLRRRSAGSTRPQSNATPAPADTTASDSATLDAPNAQKLQ